MTWAIKHISELRKGNTIKIRPLGNSMEGLISSGQLCTLLPINDDVSISVDDIVLCKIGRSVYLHKVLEVNNRGINNTLMALIGNNKGRVNGWASIKQIFGKCIKVED